MAEWYTNDLWKAYLGWLSPRWALPREHFDAKLWCDHLERGGFHVAIVHTKHHDGICFFRSKFRDTQPERDYFGEVVSEAKRRGIRVVAYYSTIFDSESAAEHPEWCCREQDGSITELKWPPFPLGACCHNNPGYGAFLLGQLEEIQTQYDTDGFWMDGFDYTGFPSHACFCDFCRERFARERGKTLDEVCVSKIGPTDELKLWQRDVFRELMEEIRRIANRNRSDRIVVFNNAGANLELGYEEIDGLCTLHSMEAHTPVTKSFMARLLACQRKPYEVYWPISDKVFSWTPRTTAMLTLEAAIVAAHGGTLLPGFDIAPSGYIPEYQTRQLGEVGRYLRARDQYLANAEPLYDVGLFLAKERWKDERGSWGITLLRNQVPFCILPLHTTEFSSCRVVVVEDGFPMTDRLAEALTRYVSGGGNVVIERDAAGIVGDGRGTGFRLAELLGVRPVGKTGFETSYIGRLNEQITDGLWDEPVRSDGEGWRVALTTAKPLAYYVYPVARYSRERWIWREPNPPRRRLSDDPAITINRCGKGNAIYIACPVGTDDRRQRRMMARLAANVVNLLIDEPLIRSETASGVEVVVARQANRHLVHLLNHYVDESSRFDRGEDTVPVLADVTVWINERRIGPVRRVVRVPQGTELPIERDGSWVRVCAERLKVHELFCLEG